MLVNRSMVKETWPSHDQIIMIHQSCWITEIYRRKFRSQTSDKMDRWKAEPGRRREKRKIRREKSRRERVRRKKMQMREKVGKSRNTVFFQWFVAPEGRKVGSLKRRVRSQLARWEMKNCTPLWREAHFEVKMYKTHHCRPLLEGEMSKKCTPKWREAHFEVKMDKTHQVRTTFGSCDVEKVHAVVPRSTFRSQKCKKMGGQNTFGRSELVSRGRHKGLCTSSKVSKTWGFCRISKNDSRRGTFEEDLQRCIFRSRRNTKDVFMRDVRRSGRWFPARCCILEHQICRFAKMILRDRCSTSYDLASLFRGRRSTLDRWSGKIAKRIGTRLSALHWTFHFFKEVSQNCFDFDVVKCKNWGSLAELLRFLCCQLWKMKRSRRLASFLTLSVQTLRKSRRIASFLMLSTLNNEDISQNSLVFKLADRQADR